MANEPGHGFAEPLSLNGSFPRGAPAIFIDQAGRLGYPCRLVSALRDEDLGRLDLDPLRRDGVGVSAVAVHPDLSTGSAFVR